MKIKRQISKHEANEKYGVIVTGVNSLYTYYLTECGKIIDSDGDIRYIPPTKYQKGKAQAIATAKEWQQEASNTAQSYGELLTAQAHFAKLAKRYGLLKEFRENGII